MEPKFCSKCKIEKSISEFNTNRTSKDGLQHWCKNCKSIENKQYRNDNIEYYRQYNKQYYKDNTDYYRQYHKQYCNKLQQTSRGNLNHKMRLLISLAFKRNQTSPTLEKLVGYSPQELKDHFESLFVDGMTWANYSIEWEVDHKMPICFFNYSDANNTEFLECWALNNLQPLWHEDNIRKGKSIPKI